MKAIQVGLMGIGTVGSGTFNVLQRNQEEIKGRAGRGIEITMVADLDTARAKQIVGEGVAVVNDARALIANPDIKGFFTPSGDMAMGIQQAVAEAGKTGQVAVVGIDGTKEQLQDIVDGGQPAAIEQFPYLMGVQSVQACVAAMGGKQIPDKVETPVLTVTKDNAQAALDAFPAPPAGFEVPNPFN